MAKIKHNNFLNTVVEVMTDAKKEGALHLYAEGNSFNGRIIEIEGRKLYHFGTTGYLGLEQDIRLKKAAIDAIERYGTQFPLSKSYISHPLYAELEEKVAAIYQEKVIITKNSTLGHMAVIPSIVDDGDAVILDHQVHWSVQNAVQPLKLRSVPVEMIRHNNLQMLEDKIKKLSSISNKIWYMADGIYSMYGDYAAIPELMALSKKYPKLHLYFDDVHGMSWKGKNGSGYVMSVLKKLPEKVVLVGTLSKTFGASGAVIICGDSQRYNKIKNFGGPLTFSAQLEPASVGAAIASATIHLTDEIYQMQQELASNISFFNELLKETDLPLIAENDSPVFYIGTGMPQTGYNLVRRLIKHGFYVNLGIFPAVPVKNTGLRITISRHNQKEEITMLTDVLNEQYYKALADTNTNLDRVLFAFGKQNQKIDLRKKSFGQLKCIVRRSIRDIDQSLWDHSVGLEGMLNWESLLMMEQVFSDNELKEQNYEFYYILILNSKDKLILGCFLTYCLWKEDMLAPESVSIEIEKQRKNYPYLHTTEVLALGSFLTEGDHLYIDQSEESAGQALDLLISRMEILEQETGAKLLVLRDFEKKDTFLKDYFQKKGFVQITMPESCIYDNFTWDSEQEYIQSLSKRSRKHFRKDIAAFRKSFLVKTCSEISFKELQIFYELYLQVKKHNPGLNTFTYPFKLFEAMNKNVRWEFIYLTLLEVPETPIVGVMFCYKNPSGNYVPNLIGMDYNYHLRFNVYRQLLFQTVLRAKELDCSLVNFGLTAGFEKRKIGATVIQKCAYLQSRDNFALESLEWLRTD
ncbi:MAG: aminotransferase class I/II-fold pyridoxal phosphate-dependent enzyme [Christiangramia sp.]